MKLSVTSVSLTNKHNTATYWLDWGWSNVDRCDCCRVNICCCRPNNRRKVLFTFPAIQNEIGIARYPKVTETQQQRNKAMTKSLGQMSYLQHQRFVKGHCKITRHHTQIKHNCYHKFCQHKHHNFRLPHIA